MQCSRCGRKLGGLFRDSGTPLKLENGSVTVCYECFLQVKREYEARKTCNDCAFFKEGYCRKIHTELTPAWIGDDILTSKDYYIQREKCVYYLTKLEYEAKAIKGEIGKEKESSSVSCEYCHTRYDWNRYVKCPSCGAPNSQYKKP